MVSGVHSSVILFKIFSTCRVSDKKSSVRATAILTRNAKTLRLLHIVKQYFTYNARPDSSG